MIGALAHKWSAPCDVNFTQNTRPMQSIHSHEATYTTTPPTVIPGEHRDKGLVSLPGMGEHHPAQLLNGCCHLLVLRRNCMSATQSSLIPIDRKYLLKMTVCLM